MKYLHSNKTADLEEAINYHRMLLASTPNSYKDEVNMASNLQLAFLRSGREEITREIHRYLPKVSFKDTPDRRPTQDCSGYLATL
jgi:hypothetical protein